MVETAKVYFVGANLGDPDLLTRKAERLLRTADAVIHDPLLSAQVLCLINPGADVASVSAGSSQEERNADVYGWYLRMRESHRVLVRLTSTDPLLAGEAGEEFEFLARHGFEIEVVPGVLAETLYECRAAVREANAAAIDAGKAVFR